MQAKKDAEYKASDLSQDITRKEAQLDKYKSELKRCNQYRETLIAQWKEINARTLTFNENDFVCPTCHRLFEIDEIEEKQQEMTQRFNQSKADDLKENSRVGKENTQHIKEIEAAISETEAAIASTRAELESLKASDAYTANPSCPDAEPSINADSEWQDLSQRIAELENETKEPVQMNNTSELKEQCRKIDDEIDALKSTLANQSIIERNNARIAELEKQLRTEAEELAELEGIEFTIAEFTRARIEEVDKRINSMFSLVKFKMYEKQINGGEAETCIATVGGIPYPDLNDAKKVNAGLDIINAICRFEGITAPIYIDNAESVNKLLDTASQQIRLVVTFDEKLIINNNIQRDLFN